MGGSSRVICFQSGQWLVDEEAVVARNDVVYAAPSPEPWEAMPVGGGDLSAMVRWDGSLHLHLTKSDCWGFAAPPDAPQGTRFFSNVSPGHVRLIFGPRAEQAACKRFRQQLDLYHGRVVVELGEGDEAAWIAVWGHPERRLLIVEISDPTGLLAPATVELSESRETMRVGCTDARLHASEVHTRPARPHLANTGMQDYYPEGRDPLQDRGTAVVVSSPDAPPVHCAAEGLTATLKLPEASPTAYRVLIGTAVTEAGDPLQKALAEFRSAESVPAERLRRQHDKWWQKYWDRSFIRLSSPNREAEWLNAAYYVHLYTLGCTNRGSVPAKWDGGAGLMRGDERNWGISEWVQEVRFTFLPLYAANRLEMARGFSDFYTRMRPYLQAQTERMWDLPGIWIPETVTPWGHAEDWVLHQQPPGTLAHDFPPWDPETAPYGKFHHYNPYIGFLFTAGLEACQHYLTYAYYSGDQGFLREQAYPMIRDVSAFVISLLRKGDDGRCHLDPANALETWWMVRDPTDTMDGLRAILPEFIRLSEQYDADHQLRERCEDVLDKLPDPPRAAWREDGTIDETADVYAPAAEFGDIPGRINCENPQLYRVFPFGLSGIGADDYELARRTFEQRICTLTHGWAMDAIWAARLGLGEEACALLTEHARKYNRFRYGGWDSNDSNVFPGGLAVAPFLDAGGLSACALQEILLQSHGGIIRIAPAVGAAWSGVFRLRGEGGFLVTADVDGGVVRLAEVKSLLGGVCTIANPWPGECVVRQESDLLLRSGERTLAFPTRRGGTYLLENADCPLAAYRPEALSDARNATPGLPGRDG